MIIKNGRVLMDSWEFENINIVIEAGVIKEFIGKNIENTDDENIIDAEGCIIVPGLVDIHIHGCDGHDFCDGTKEAINSMSSFLAKNGITSFLATSMALPLDKLEKIFAVGAEAIKNCPECQAKLLGIHMEGPFFNKIKKGAQAGKNIIDPDLGFFEHLYNAALGEIKLMAIAPELDGSMEMIEKISDRLKVSIGHTVADYETAMKAIEKGASHITHLFNAMPAFTHRDPGVVGAAMDSDVSVELICDGFHIHPAVVRSVFKMFGAERVVLVSDAMRACGLHDGDYELGGQPVRLDSGKATLSDGTLAGSATSLLKCMQNAISFGIAPELAIKAATFNPAKAVGAETNIGSISIGKSADMLLLDKNYNLQKTIINGSLL